LRVGSFYFTLPAPFGAFGWTFATVQFFYAHCLRTVTTHPPATTTPTGFTDYSCSYHILPTCPMICRGYLRIVPLYRCELVLDTPSPHPPPTTTTPVAALTMVHYAQQTNWTLDAGSAWMVPSSSPYRAVRLDGRFDAVAHCTERTAHTRITALPIRLRPPPPARVFNSPHATATWAFLVRYGTSFARCWRFCYRFISARFLAHSDVPSLHQFGCTGERTCLNADGLLRHLHLD